MSSLYCLPIVFSNLGVEMLYVLEQRLRAQKISEDKAVKVLHDVVKAMFDPQFVDELFKPQEVYTCLLYTSPSPRDATLSRMPSSA